MADLDATVARSGAHVAISSDSASSLLLGRTHHLAVCDAPVPAEGGVAWYVKLEIASTPIKPRHPVDIAGDLRAPVLGLYGARDESIPLETIEQMKSVLASGNAAARASDLVVYPDTGHAFHADYRPSYREADARDGWSRCVAWFERHGVRP